MTNTITTTTMKNSLMIDVSGSYDIRNENGDGPWVRYYDNGQLLSKGDYKNDKKEGPWVSYHKDGQLSYKGDYKNGKKEGPWVGYDEDGTVDEEWSGMFRNGKKVGK